ncbi:MAG TPA: hypothetical protein VGM93_02865, partial [Acidimicrobiales bacterium]
YQQVGRAGRQLPESLGVLLRGFEDADIQDWFISRAFPSREEAEQAVAVLDERGGFVKAGELEKLVNVRPSRMQLLLKNLEVDGAVEVDGRSYRRTATPWAYDAERVEGITALRRHEQEQMSEFASDTIDCRMAFLRRLLDDPHIEPCGICDRCRGPRLPQEADPGRARAAVEFVRRRPLRIEPRKKWPEMTNIPPAERTEVGRALGRWSDGGWGELVRHGKEHGQFADELVSAACDLVRGEWRPDPGPAWVTYVPSMRQPDLVADLAKRIAATLDLPLVDALRRARDTPPQAEMDNSFQQHRNAARAFEAQGAMPSGPALLVDDVVRSRWTLTQTGALLRREGCEAVLPLALADDGAG